MDGTLTTTRQPDYTETPAHLPTMESHVKVPAAQSIITAFVIGVPFAFVSGVFGYSFGNLTIFGSIVIGFGSGVAAFFVVAAYNWLSRVSNYNQLLWRVEEFLNTDINSDGETGKPEPRQIRVEVTENKSTLLATLPGDEESLWNFANDVVAGVANFSESGAQHSGYGVSNFRSLRDDFFIPNGWAYWKDGRRSTAGVVLTVSGTQTLRGIANENL